MKTEKEIKSKLLKLLDPSRIKKHSYSGFDYIESWDAIKTANDIFGIFGWSTHIDDIRLVSEVEVGEKYEVSYMATATVTVSYIDDDGVARCTTQSGSGHDIGTRKKLSEAHGMAIKNAESDAEKRALRKFGNQFGLALYDESRKGVASTSEEVKGNDEDVNFKDINRISSFLNRELARAEKQSFTTEEFRNQISNNENIKAAVERLKSDSPEDFISFENAYKHSYKNVSEREASKETKSYL